MTPNFIFVKWCMCRLLCLNNAVSYVIQLPKDRKCCEKQGSSRQYDVDTLDRGVKINRRATFIRKVRVGYCIGSVELSFSGNI